MNNIYENKIIESDDHMARVLAGTGFDDLPDVLLEDERFTNGLDTAAFYPKNDKDEARISICLQNFDTFVPEQYIYTLEHFIQLIRKIMTHIKDTGLEKYDEQLREIIMSHEGVTERLEKYEQLIRKYESYIAENQTESK